MCKAIKKELHIFVTAEDYENEIWNVIPSFEEYEASSLGRVRRIKSVRPSLSGRILKPDVHKHGYLRVVLWMNNKDTTHIYVHRLVALAFLSNTDNLPEVNHKNFNRVDCRVENLEWCTRQENNHHKYINGRFSIGEDVHNSKLDEMQVITICGRINDGEFCTDIAKDYGVAQETINSIASGRTWKHITKNVLINQSNRYKGKFINTKLRNSILKLRYSGVPSKDVAIEIGHSRSIVNHITRTAQRLKISKDGYFDCYWCLMHFKNNVYIYPTDDVGGYDSVTDLPICKGCKETALSLM
jgi:hypothetical protein